MAELICFVPFLFLLASLFIAVMFVDSFLLNVLVVLVGYFLMKISNHYLKKYCKKHYEEETKKDFQPIAGRFIIGMHWFEGYEYFFEILLDGSCVYTFKWSDENSCRKYKSIDYPFKTKASEELMAMLDVGKSNEALSVGLKDLKQKLLEEFLEIKEEEKLRKLN